MTASTARRWVILFIIVALQAFSNISNLIFSSFGPSVIAQFNMTDMGQLAPLTTLNILPTLFLSILIGNLMDRKGVKWIVCIGLGLTAILMIWRIFADSYTMLLVITLGIGICGVPFQVGAAKMLGLWFPRKEMPIAAGFFTVGSGLGSALAFFLGAAFPGLTFALTVIAIIAVILALLWFAFVKDRAPVEASEAGEPPKAPKHALSLVLKSPTVWKITIMSGLAIGTAFLVNIYMVSSLVAVKGMTEQDGQLVTGLLNICLLIGSLAWTFIVRRVAKFNITHATACIGGCVFYLLAWFLPFGPQTLVFVALAGLIVSGSIGINNMRVPVLPLTKEFGMECVATANGLNYTGVGALAFLTPTIVAMVAGSNADLVFIINGVLLIVIAVISLTTPELGEKGKLAAEARGEIPAAEGAAK